MTAGALTARLSESGRGPAASRIQLGTRQARSDVANFRDHGRMVDRPLLRLLSRLQKMPGGHALVSEASLRAMIHQDTGHLPGVGTIPQALRRMEERHGLVETRWIHKNSIRPDGRPAEVGCLRIRVGEDRADRCVIRKRARTVNRRENAGLVRPEHDGWQAVQAALRVPPPAPASVEARELAADKARPDWNARAAEWVALYGNDGKGPAPP